MNIKPKRYNRAIINFLRHTKKIYVINNYDIFPISLINTSRHLILVISYYISLIIYMLHLCIHVTHRILEVSFMLWQS